MKKIIYLILILLLSNFAYSYGYVNASHDLSGFLTLNNDGCPKCGILFTPHYNVTVLNITATNGTTPSHCEIADRNWNTIKSGSCTGTVCQLTGGVNLTKDTEYFARCNGTTAWTFSYKNMGGAWSVDTPMIIWNGSTQLDADLDVNYARQVLTLGLFNTSDYYSGTIIFRSPTPSDKDIGNDYSIITINITSTVGNISAYWNNILVGNGSESSPFSYTLNNSLVNQNKTYIYWAYNGIDNITREWTYDNIAPNITINNGSSFSSNNVTLNFELLLLNLTFRDNDLVHAYSINVTNSAGVSLYDEYNDSVDLTNLTIYRNIDVSGFALGDYKISTVVADGHTINEIKKYDYLTKTSQIVYKTAEENNIKISTEDISEFSTEKKTDRYSYTINFLDREKVKERKIYLETDKKLNYINNKKYQGWFVTINWAKKEGNWIDFEGQGKVKKITRISDYKYEIIYEAENDEITFNSIGGLNFAFKDFLWSYNVINIDNCSNYNYTILNLSYFDETTLEKINPENSYSLNFTINSLAVSDAVNGTSNDYYTKFCSKINLSDYTINVFGNNLLSKENYASLYFNIPQSHPFYATTPKSDYSLYMIKLNESSTVNYNWYTTEYTAIDGTLLIYKCSGTGEKTLIESTPIVDSKAVANIRLLDVPYSYSVLYNGVLYSDDTGFSACHIESDTSITYYIDVSGIDISPYIGLQGVYCNIEKLTSNSFNFSWGKNAYDTSQITGCISVERAGISGYVTTDSICSNTTYIVRTIPTTGYSYLVNSKIYQSGYSKQCNSISFNLNTDTGSLMGLTGIFGSILLIIALVLMFSSDSENSLFAAIIGLIVVWVIGLTKFEWLDISLMIAFLGIIAYIGRRLRYK